MECKTAQTRSFGVKLESMSIEAKGTHAGWSLERRLQVAHAFIRPVDTERSLHFGG